MKEIFNDFQFISEEKILELSKAYENCLNKVKIKCYSDEFKQKIQELDDLLNTSLHVLNNLINNSSNGEMLRVLQEYQKLLKEKKENIQQIYNFEFVLNLNNDNNLYDKNIYNLIDNLLKFLEKLFDLIRIEDNAKIKNTLSAMFFEIIDIIKKLNLYKTNTLKVFSIFKKY